MNYLWNPLRIVCIVMVKLFKANSDVIWRLWLWSCACLRKDAWSTVEKTPGPLWRWRAWWITLNQRAGVILGFMIRLPLSLIWSDLMPVLAGQPSSFCQCPSTYFCEGCWVTISCVLVVPVSLPDFLTDLYWSTICPSRWVPEKAAAPCSPGRTAGSKLPKMFVGYDNH